jgi:hypothetical protein
MATNEDLEKIKAALENFEVAGKDGDTVTIGGVHDDEYVINLDDILTSTMSNYQLNTPYTGGNITINTGGTSGLGITGATGSTFSTGYNTFGPINYGAQGSPGLHVSSDAIFDGDIKWKGRSLGSLLGSIEDRLAILQDPDPAKLEKHAALKKAYDHYKTLERLIGDE